MSIRHLEGYIYEHIPNYGKGDCARCGYGPGCCCQARPDGRRKRGMPGVILCGPCWEDTPAGELAEFIDERLKALRTKETTMDPLYPSTATFNPRSMDTHPNVVCYDYDHGNQWAAFRCTCAGCTWFLTKVDTKDKTPEQVREVACMDHDGFATGE